MSDIYIFVQMTSIMNNFDGIQPEPLSHHRTPQLIEFIQRHQSIRDRGSHSKLQTDLVEHIWNYMASDKKL